jgi:hypothetical protein
MLPAPRPQSGAADTSLGTVTRETLPSELGQVGTDVSWWDAVAADLARAEYAATPIPAGLQAPNRAHNLRTTFTEHGIAAVPRIGRNVAPAWRFSWETRGIGRTGRMESVDPAHPEREGARVTYRHDGWSEWYENTAKGLEQGFTIERKPDGEGPLRIAGRVPATLEPRARADGAVDFMDGHGACVIRYGELHAWDARGVELVSKLVVAEADLAILVEDHGAAYPLTVDPLMTSPAWTAESDQNFAVFGFSVATAGDVNGDGFSDVIVGAYSYDNGQTDEGRTFVYEGSAAGLVVTPSWTAESDQASSSFGYSVATAGDVNGDGYSDVIVGAWTYDDGQSNEGRVFVYHGSATGLSATPAWTAESDQADAAFGFSVATAGDVNGDGFADVIVGAWGYDGALDHEGRAYVYQGSATGLATTPAWTVDGGQVGAELGRSVSTAGDVNGDGFSDVLVGARLQEIGELDEGVAFAYHGSAAGLGTTPAWTEDGNQVSAQFGASVATAGDVNGDGYGDVIVGAHFYDGGQSDEGRAFVYPGSAAGLSTTPAWTAESDQASAEFGTSVATAGDVNGDGYADVIVGAYVYDNGQGNEGRAYVYTGSASGLGAVAVWTAESDQASAQFGVSVATAGDVDGDGYGDVIVGAHFYDNGQSNEGRAFVYHGSAAGLAVAPGWTADGDQDFPDFGTSVATAGDVNGDGYSDVIVGARKYDNGEPDEGRAFVYHGSAAGPGTAPAWTAEADQAGAGFGRSVATAGDVNGDGYDDVIVGAHEYDNGESNEGRAYVYHGSATGLAATPAWTAESDHPGDNFGWSAATAGDVNGDGFSDVIVGAPIHGIANLGLARVYHGSADGLLGTPAWSVESDQGGSQFGWSVATAGDVNGDGFSDVIVGAFWYNNGQAVEGRVFVYHGSIDGLAMTPAWIAESDQVEARFGYSVATAGDVNGDGYSDAIVGAIQYTNGQSSEGRAFLYLGSAAGLTTSPAWTAESDQELALFGSSVATAGDVNGDGFSDVIVGCPWYDNPQTYEGRAFVYAGSPAGLGAAPAWTAEGDQTFAYYGSSVATAGDLNGDGYSDVIVGAYGYDSGQADEGRTFVYYGNEGDGLDRIPRQARTDDTTPIALLGRSDSESAVLLKALGRTAAGRGRVRLQYEVRPFGAPFDGSGVVTGDVVDTGTPVVGTGSAAPLAELATGLTPETLYHWRLRLLADSPFFPRSPWLTACGNAATETDLRTAPDVISVAGASQVTTASRLESCAPNPFTTTTVLSYALAGRGRVRLAVYDVSGREVLVLADDVQEAGRHTRVWDGRGASGRALVAGVYFARLEFEGRVEGRKLILTR